MKDFIKKIFIISTITIIPIILFYSFNLPFIAANRISNSISFNEKIKWIPAAKKIDVITFGSSMSLNNISSSEILTYFDTNKYLNVSSWGINMNDIEKLLPLFKRTYNPTIVICASNIIDFSNNKIIKYNIVDVEEEINNKWKKFHINLFDIYYFRKTLTNRKDMTSNKIYGSLLFDSYGGVSLANENFERLDSRWNQEINFEVIDKTAYENLKNISTYLYENNIQFIFIHTPVRKVLHTKKYYKQINNHVLKIKTILNQRDQLFIDLSSLELSDSLFADSSHLNKIGADSISKIIGACYINKKRSIRLK